jgi:hypothetical protein
MWALMPMFLMFSMSPFMVSFLAAGVVQKGRNQSILSSHRWMSQNRRPGASAGIKKSLAQMRRILAAHL